MRILLGLLLALGLHASSTTASTAPARVEIKYRVSLGSMKIGEGLDVFQQDGKTYSVVSESKTSGLAAVLYNLNIRREAKGEVTASGLRPLSFVETRNGQVKRGATFDWSAKQVQLTDGTNKQSVALPSNTWDSTTFAWNFIFAPPEGKELDINLTDGRRITNYKYAVLGREKLNVPAGELTTLHVKKIQEEGDKRAFDVWIAIERHNLPIRIRYTEKDGTAFDSVAESINVVQP